MELTVSLLVRFPEWSRLIRRFTRIFIISPQWHDTTTRACTQRMLLWLRYTTVPCKNHRSVCFHSVWFTVLSPQVGGCLRCVSLPVLFVNCCRRLFVFFNSLSLVFFLNMSTALNTFFFLSIFMYRHSNTADGNGRAHTTRLHSQSTQ